MSRPPKLHKLNLESSVSTGHFLHNRVLRRRMLMALVGVLIVSIMVGTWLVEAWLGAALIRFVVYWAIVGMLTVLLALLCLYDLLRLGKEIRREEGFEAEFDELSNDQSFEI